MIQHSIEHYILNNFKGMFTCIYFNFPPGILFLQASFPFPPLQFFFILLSILLVNYTLYICQDFIPVVSF